MILRYALASLLLIIFSGECMAGKWLTYEDCEFVESKYFDGDSFSVKAGTGYTYVFRLYGVDCPETDSRYPERLAEQAKDFGVTPEQLLQWGEKAKDFTKKFLSKPFTVHTRKISARGSSKKRRYYAIVVDSSGKRLDEALLEAGLARAFGYGADWPEEMEVERFLRKLGHLENKAKREDVGIWEISTK